MRRLALLPVGLSLLLAACENDLVTVEDMGDAARAGAFEAPEGDEQAMVRSCRPSQTVKGIDVSYYQERIDWNAVAADGVKFAFIRVSDGVNFQDPRFEENWRNARAAGVKRGAYQFFRSNRDPIAQADLLLENMGPLEDGDLPPVIDVESTDGQSSATIAAKVSQWINRVESVLGVKPIIYTGPYFWRDQVRSQAFAGYPLWIAHYGTECPLIPEPWSTFTFHQFTDSGRVAGIRGNVDTNVFAGTLADLDALAFHTGATTPPPAPSVGCQEIPATGGVMEEDNACVVLGGPAQYLRAVDGEGHGGSLVWTHATQATTRDNYAEWTLRFAQPGRYRVSVWTDMSVATSRLATYRIEHDGVVESRQIDQHAADGFRELGTFDFASGTGKVVLDDNTGEALSLQRVIVIDALSVQPATSAPPPPAPTCTRVKVVNASALNIRPTASTAQAPIGTLSGGEVVDRLDSAEGQSIHGNRTWHRIQKGGLRGYVSAYYTTCVN